ncbi:MAG: hypothetical protein K9G67_08290 [Bacteroidales bacterium]|mgnify:CR=1 FL=1|nr:hypothetical protein [Bacteroidales bacterium]MCF8343915.1 hypothetical protein [Bacteroidales bacterium]MCF8350793.1 hypothetical protein [Bacteroidales bacterium]MCF8376337.1 hypothetical protein [Bacteroidales bacterium]MCF8400503.1 hypothetical protein [Bacteroidales bacterium]
MNEKKLRTDFLVSTPSFLSGFGSIYNLSGKNYSYNSSETDIEADRNAIRNDWQMIGQDIFDALVKAKNSFSI